MKNSLLITAALLLCCLSLPAAAAVSAALDRDEVAAGDTVQLLLRHEGRGGGEPDLGPLKQDFDVLGSSSGSSIQFINGALSSQRELRLTLAPKHSGKLRVPALSWGGEQSDPLELTVTEGGSADSQASGATDAHAAHVFLTASVDQKQPYVQGAVLLTIQLHTDQPLYQASLDLPGNNDVQVQQIGKDQRRSETRNGRQFDVIERQYLLQPQRSGTLSLDGPTLDAQVAGGSGRDPFANSPFADAFGRSPFAGMNSMRPMRLHGDPIVLEVRPRPAAAEGRDWLPAKQLTLEEAWRPESASVHTGEPLTLHLGLKAQGLAAAQLPDLSAELQLPDGLKAYPDQAKLDTTLQSGAIAGSREQDVALIASKPGHYLIPALHLHWWDTRQDAAREAVLPERTLDILPAAGTAADASPAPAPPAALAPLAPASGGSGDQAAPAPGAAPVLGQNLAPTRSPWLWVSLLLGALWLATIAAWWLQRRRSNEPSGSTPATPKALAEPDTGSARAAFQRACKDHDAPAARRALLSWARAQWPQNPPPGLNALAERLNQPALTGLLHQLDRACYAGADWQGDALGRALSSLSGTAGKPQKAPQLAPLYPS